MVAPVPVLVLFVTVPPLMVKSPFILTADVLLAAPVLPAIVPPDMLTVLFKVTDAVTDAPAELELPINDPVPEIVVAPVTVMVAAALPVPKALAANVPPDIFKVPPTDNELVEVPPLLEGE